MTDWLFPSTIILCPFLATLKWLGSIYYAGLVQLTVVQTLLPERPQLRFPAEPALPAAGP
jgi:hypothetical protein